MARVTVEDCLQQEFNRFALVVLAAKRSRLLAKGAKPLMECNNKPVVTALREIADGHVHFNENVEEVVHEYLREIRNIGKMPPSF